MVRRLGVLALALVVLAGCGNRPAHPAPSAGASLPDPSNQLPFGTLDAPTTGATLPADVTVSGWAMDDKGVAGIRVYVDGHFMQATTLTIHRPDVSAAVPLYARQSDRHGWTVRIGLKPGPHTVLAQAVDDVGATRDLGSVSVTVRP